MKPLGNKHDSDHTTDNFYATHPYLIYVINCTDIVIIERTIIHICDKTCFSPKLAYLAD